MDSEDRAARLLATGMLLGAMCGGPYNDIGFKILKGKPRRGWLVGCHVCGASGVTLYKDGEERIGGKCRKEKGDLK